MFLQHKWRNLVFISLCCSLLIAYYFLVPERINLELNTNYDFECIENKSSVRKHICFEYPHIFFVETSGSESLNPRQACAVESTARHNPSMNVYVLMAAPYPLDYNHNLMKNLKSLQNINLLRIDIDVLVYNSPIFKWYRQGKWKGSKWKASHLSDALRFFLIWKYGGTYLDMDIVSFHSLEYVKNAAITEDWSRTAAGILLNFDKNHEMMKKCMFDFANNYDPYNFVKNGPVMFTNNIKNYCNTNLISQISGADCNISILPPNSAFPIPYDKWKDYFVESSVKNITEAFNSSYLIHVWNKYSKAYKLKVGTNSLYELAIKQHCPLVYNYVLKVGFI